MGKMFLVFYLQAGTHLRVGPDAARSSVSPLRCTSLPRRVWSIDATAGWNPSTLLLLCRTPSIGTPRKRVLDGAKSWSACVGKVVHPCRVKSIWVAASTVMNMLGYFTHEIEVLMVKWVGIGLHFENVEPSNAFLIKLLFLHSIDC
jgi:hypothetical protein